MGSRGLHARIFDMLKAIESLETMRTLERQDASLAPVLALAMERAIEIISEASRHIPDDLKATASEITWRQIAGIGNVLRHDYQAVRPAILTSVIERDLPGLKTVLLAFQARLADK